jgi:ketosteroid isomerase-like protein
VSVTDPIAVVRYAYDLIARGEYDEFFALLDDQMVWVDRAAIPVSGRLQGREQVEEHFHRWFASWDRLSYEFEEIIEDGSQVFSVVRRRGREVKTGIEREDRAAYVYEIHDGLVTKMTGYTDRDAAVEASGLRR